MSVSLLVAWSDVSGSLTFPTITAGANRKAIIVIGRTNGSATATINSGVTVGGVAATYEGGFPQSAYNRVTVGIWSLNEAQIALMSGSTIVPSGGSGDYTMISAGVIKDTSQELSTLKNFAHNDDAGATSGSLSLERLAESYTIYAVSNNVANTLSTTNPATQLTVVLSNHRLCIGSSVDTANTSDCTYVSSGASRSAQVAVNFAPVSTPPAINPTGTDVTAYPGQSRTAVMQNVVATPTAIAYVYNGTIVSTHTDFEWTAGDDGAGTITYTVAQGNLPYGNTDLVIRVSFDSGDPVTLDGMELTVEPDYQYVVAAGTLVTETEESIWSGYEGDTPVAGYQTHTPTATSDARTITVDPTGTWVAGAGDGSSPDGYSFPVRVWDGTDWDSYTVTVDLSGGVDPEPGDGGLTSVGFTVEGFTVRGFTARGF